MAKFRFETEVEQTVVVEYFIEADSLEEANGNYKLVNIETKVLY
jgi:hypothetical protein